MTSRLSEVLAAAVKEGFLTARIASAGVDHSEGFLGPGGQQQSFIPQECDLAVDLGTGGGLPGVALAVQTMARWVLVERSARRSQFLEWAVKELDLTTRVEVINTDARDLARSNYRGQAVLVTARAFGSPAVTAEIGAALLGVGGRLVVSEPPPRKGNNIVKRWPLVGIVRLGLKDSGSWHNGLFGYKALSCVSLTPNQFPRKGPAMASDPLF